jgi:hypothetical protein
MTHRQASPAPTPPPRVENRRASDLHPVETELPLAAAKALVGRVVANTLRLTESFLKEFGDKSQVRRWARGEENPNLARLAQRPEVRRVLALELLATCQGVEVTTHVRVPVCVRCAR